MVSRGHTDLSEGESHAYANRGPPASLARVCCTDKELSPIESDCSRLESFPLVRDAAVSG